MLGSVKGALAHRRPEGQRLDGEIPDRDPSTGPAAAAKARDAADVDDLVDEWGRQSFPASDPPANW
jgi:hypothetical protein